MANKICTSIKQSKKLIELGIDVNTADMRYGYIAPYEYSDRMFDGGYDEVPYPKDFLKKNPNFSENEYDGEFPAWSFSSLIDILPDTITDEEGTIFGLNIKKNFIEYYNPSMGALYATYHSIIAEDLVDAAFEMICWLSENKKL